MFNLRELPYKKDAFNGSGFISDKTFDYHYAKHHQTYVNNLNNLIAGGEFESKGLYEIVLKSSGGIFNNAAQVYNHDFYWDCISVEKSSMSADLEGAIKATFGESFREEFIKAATTLFGSGWCWLVLDENQKLQIVQTSNADTPAKRGQIPLLVVDVWEHAYYIDHKNVRPQYLEKFFEHINWAFVSKAYEWALKEGTGSIRFYMEDIHKEQK